MKFDTQEKQTCTICKKEIEGISYLVKYQVVSSLPFQKEIMCSRCLDELLDLNTWSLKVEFSNEPGHVTFTICSMLLIQPIFYSLGLTEGDYYFIGNKND